MKKTSLIQIRVTGEEREHIDSLANAEGRSTAGYIRHRLFDPDLPQMEHQATDAAHRPLAEPLTITSAAGAPNSYSDTGSSSVSPQSWMERNSVQTARDEILRGINKKAR